ncbi:MAG: ATP-dependent zinc protease [Wenzhouxiangella sp.]
MSAHVAPSMIIGACEWVALPELGIDRLRARVDTGAKSCALHASHIEPFEHNGVDWVRFRVHLGHPQPRADRDCQALLQAVRRVRPTSGEFESRYTIRTPIVIGHARWMVDITLTDRGRMRYRMLLGRKAMENHALVYPARTFLQGKPRLDAGL